ncbi:MAG: hypothetical protein J0M02_01295 [Planctomycetes bacterium]|nr:hypothetical protein [Planctomycetota bacterium]
MSAPRKSISFRVSADVHKRIRHFLRERAAAPWYLKPTTFAESALRRELERLERCLASGEDPGFTADTDDEPDVRADRRLGLNTHNRR